MAAIHRCVAAEVCGGQRKTHVALGVQDTLEAIKAIYAERTRRSYR